MGSWWSAAPWAPRWCWSVGEPTWSRHLHRRRPQSRGPPQSPPGAELETVLGPPAPVPQLPQDQALGLATAQGRAEVAVEAPAQVPMAEGKAQPAQARERYMPSQAAELEEAWLA